VGEPDKAGCRRGYTSLFHGFANSGSSRRDVDILVLRVVLGIDAASREHPHAAKRNLRSLVQHQHFDLRGFPQQNDSRCRNGIRNGIRVTTATIRIIAINIVAVLAVSAAHGNGSELTCVKV